jgi:23S rRNA (cytidine1920-2'-O)/16S rRNA (cytidine1409-2'-O)-methyltransferase
VFVAGAPATKPSRLVAPDQGLTVAGPAPRFVSRGGVKLDAALTTFQVDPQGRIALDAGASTGGFTDCLLQRGAAEVVAVDVGRGQLHERLRTDPRVHVLDNTNVRHLRPDALPVAELPSLAVADLSFISLTTVAPALLELTSADVDLVLLVKPQFEAGRQEARRGRGVIRDPDVWRRAIAGVDEAFRRLGAAIVASAPSPLLGSQGNVEFLAHVRREPNAGAVDLDAVIARTPSQSGE